MHTCKQDPNIPVVCIHVANLHIRPVTKGVPPDLYICKQCLEGIKNKDEGIQNNLSCICKDCIKENIPNIKLN